MHLPLPDMTRTAVPPHAGGYLHRAHSQQLFVWKTDVTDVSAQSMCVNYTTCSLLLLSSSKSTGLLQRGEIKYVLLDVERPLAKTGI